MVNDPSNVGPQLETLAQYIKDFSFENPRAPLSLMPQEDVPGVSVNVHVNAKPLEAQEFEVELMLEGQVGEGEAILFRFDIKFAGIFKLINVPESHVSEVLMVECPRLLFPFVRSIVATTVREGGFPQFFLQPIDFNQLFQAKMAEFAQNQQKLNG